MIRRGGSRRRSARLATRGCGCSLSASWGRVVTRASRLLAIRRTRDDATVTFGAGVHDRLREGNELRGAVEFDAVLLRNLSQAFAPFLARDDGGENVIGVRLHTSGATTKAVVPEVFVELLSI